jgi:inner membrane protein
MLVLGHAGITLGAAAIAAGVVNRKTAAQTAKASWFDSLARYLDIRILMVGALLPDIIDKPVGQYIFRDTFGNGRIFSHTLLFLLILTAVGIILYRSRRHTWMLALAAGTFMHLVLDEMWGMPATLFWPFMGLDFGKAEISNYLSNIFQALFTDPKSYIPEIAGLAILLWFGITVIVRKKAGVFLRYGKMD